MHGDSIMGQMFHTLACMLDSSVTIRELEGPGKKQQSIRFTEEGIEIPPIKAFTYSHAHGTTQFKYSRAGIRFRIGQKTLYKHDFPYAVKTLTSKDVIF